MSKNKGKKTTEGTQTDKEVKELTTPPPEPPTTPRGSGR